MTLEDFEKSLADSKQEEDITKSKSRHRSTNEHRSHHHSHHRSHHRDEDASHRHRRRRESRDGDEHETEHRSHRHRPARDGSTKHAPASGKDERDEGDTSNPPATDEGSKSDQAPTSLKRDSWMEAPSALAVDFVQRPPRDALSASAPFVSAKADFEHKIRALELQQHHLRASLPNEHEPAPETLQQPAQHEVDYVFGDAGAQWRMLQLQAVYRQAAAGDQTVEEAAVARYGDLRAFDDAREEAAELERRQTYGAGYVGRERPSGELFQERKLGAGVRRGGALGEADGKEVSPARIQEVETGEPVVRTAPLDQTALNRLKAQMLKAKLRGAADAGALEAEYGVAMAAAFANRKEAEVVVLGTMENRMLTGGRQGEVKEIGSKRGRERGLVEENEDMSIEDMVREERRTRGQAGGEGQRFAERIAKDGKFDVSARVPVVRLMLTSM